MRLAPSWRSTIGWSNSLSPLVDLSARSSLRFATLRGSELPCGANREVRRRAASPIPNLLWDEFSSQFTLGGGSMKAVVIGESSGASMEAIMAVYPRHKALVDMFKA